RFCRSPYYHSANCPWAQARGDDWEYFDECRLGCPAMTLVPPNASPRECRSALIKCGKSASCKKDGRPLADRPESPKQIRTQQLAMACRLHREGLSLREIEEQIDVPFRTVGDWLKTPKAVR